MARRERLPDLRRARERAQGAACRGQREERGRRKVEGDGGRDVGGDCVEHVGCGAGLSVPVGACV